MNTMKQDQALLELIRLEFETAGLSHKYAKVMTTCLTGYGLTICDVENHDRKKRSLTVFLKVLAECSEDVQEHVMNFIKH